MNNNQDYRKGYEDTLRASYVLVQPIINCQWRTWVYLVNEQIERDLKNK